MKFLLIFLFSFLISQDVFDGYVLYTPGGGGTSATTYLKDTDGTTINSWSHARGPASMPYLFPDGSIIYPYTVEYPTMTAVSACRNP